MEKLLQAMQLKKYNVKQKFAIVIVVLVFVFSFVFFFGYFIVYNQLINSLIINQYQSIESVNHEVSSYFTEIEAKIDKFIETPTVRTYLYKKELPENQEEFLIHFKKDLHETTSTPFLNSLYIVKEDHYLGSNYNSNIDEGRIEDLICYIRSRYQNRFDSRLISVPKGDISDESLIFYCIPVPRTLDSTMMDKAFIAIDISPTIFDSALSRYFSAMSRTFPLAYTIFDNNDNIIYCSEGIDSDESVYRDILVTDNQFMIAKINGKSTLLINHSIYEAKIFVSIRIRMADVLKPTWSFSSIVLAVFVAAILFIWLFMLQMTKGITKRLAEMLQVMDKVEKGNLEVRYIVKHNDEISIIGKKFNTMIDNLNNMKINIMALKLRQREAELNNLQSYIKPHFMINTIEAIRMTAILENDKVTAEQLMLLGQSFRYLNSFNKDLEFVTVGDEVENVNVYLSLIKLRFEGKYEIMMDIDNKILGYKSLQLILQPIVENVFIHGLKNKKSGSMKVIGYLKNKNIVFDVIDDGEGISEKKLRKIKDSFAETEKSSSQASIGMKNVNARLKLAYGENFGVFIFSELNKGTKVRVIFPAKRKDETRRVGEEPEHV